MWVHPQLGMEFPSSIPLPAIYVAKRGAKNSDVSSDNKHGEYSSTSLLSITQENSVDLHSTGTVPQHSRQRSCENVQILSKTFVYITAWHSNFVTTNLKSNLRTPLKKRDTTDNISTASYAQNTTVLQPTVFFAGIHRLLVVNTGLSASPSANNRQGQLQTPHSVWVLGPQHSPATYTNELPRHLTASKQVTTQDASRVSKASVHTIHVSLK
jgi:hypothetical protein